MAMLLRVNGKTNRSRLGPRCLLYTWFIPPNLHAAIPASAANPSSMEMPTASFCGASSYGVRSLKVGWGREGSPCTRQLPCSLSPPKGKEGGRQHRTGVQILKKLHNRRQKVAHSRERGARSCPPNRGMVISGPRGVKNRTRGREDLGVS